MFRSRIFLPCMLAVFLTGCQSAKKSSVRACCQIALAPAPAATGKTFLESDSVWQDDHGKNFRFAELRGQPAVIAMFFASCEGVCVITRNDMQAVEASLPAPLRERTVFILVTLAPDRDTAAVLNQYRIENGLSEKRWRLLRGSAAATAAVAAQLDVGYGRDASGLFRHSSEITVLDDMGKIVQQQDGIHADLAATVKVLAAAEKN